MHHWVVRFVLLLLFLPPGRADACTCLPNGPPCAAYWEVGAVFVGRVDSVASAAENPIGGARVVQFTVLERFRGVDRTTVEVRTGRGGGDCGYRFKEGGEYFVYAYRQDGSSTLATGICTRTRPVEDAGADLAYARALAGSDPPAGRISGQVSLHHRRLGRGAVPPPEPLGGMPVVLDGPKGTLRTVTDRYGAFDFMEPAPGTYTVRLELPEGYYTEAVPPLRLPDARACADLPIVVFHDGRVSGRVLDSARQPVAGLTVELVTADGPNRVTSFDGPRTLTRGDGTYEFSRVPPGRFTLGVATRSGADEPTESRVLDPRRLAVTAGGRTTVPDFVLPASLTYVRLTGVVLDADGYFAPGARVYLAGPSERDPLLGEPAITDAKGGFVLAVLAGHRYRVLAERTSGRDAGSRVDSSDPVPITGAWDLPPVRLVLRARY